MGRIEQAFKAEISRLARREARVFFVPLKKQVVELKKEVAALRKEVKAQAGRIKELTTKLGMIYTPEAVLAGAETPPPEKTRLSPALIRKLRKRLKISQAELAKLVGVSLGTVGNWESGKVKPKPEYRVKLVSLRRYGVTQVRTMLREMEGGAKKGGEKR